MSDGQRALRAGWVQLQRVQVQAQQAFHPVLLAQANIQNAYRAAVGEPPIELPPYPELQDDLRRDPSRPPTRRRRRSRAAWSTSRKDANGWLRRLVNRVRDDTKRREGCDRIAEMAVLEVKRQASPDLRELMERYWPRAKKEGRLPKPSTIRRCKVYLEWKPHRAGTTTPDNGGKKIGKATTADDRRQDQLEREADEWLRQHSNGD